MGHAKGDGALASNIREEQTLLAAIKAAAIRGIALRGRRDSKVGSGRSGG